MKQIYVLILLISLSLTAAAQDRIIDKYSRADSLLNAGDIPGAYSIYKDIKPEIDEKDTLYCYVVWYYVKTASYLGKKCQMKEDYDNSLKYNLEVLKLIQENKQYFDNEFGAEEMWTVKNIVVAYFGQNKLDEAEKFKTILYKGYKDKTLPNGINDYFNFDFFKLDGKNIWGYEWFEELPENRSSKSFTKVVYYVYSTNEDGSDKDQLYRFHVLMFHQDNENTKFDYILEKQQELEGKTYYYSYYMYNYKKDIDYLKLRNDVKEHLQKKITWDSMRYYSR